MMLLQMNEIVSFVYVHDGQTLLYPWSEVEWKSTKNKTLFVETKKISSLMFLFWIAHSEWLL